MSTKISNAQVSHLDYNLITCLIYNSHFLYFLCHSAMKKATTEPAAFPTTTTPNGYLKTCPYCGALFSPMQEHECDYFERWLPTMLEETKVQPYSKNNTSSASSVDLKYLSAASRACKTRRKNVISSVYNRIRLSMRRLATTLKKGNKKTIITTTSLASTSAFSSFSTEEDGSTDQTCPYCKTRYSTERVHHCPSVTVGSRHCPTRFTELRQLAMHAKRRHHDQIAAAKKVRRALEEKMKDKMALSCRCPLCPQSELSNRFFSVEALQHHFALHKDFCWLIRCAGCRQGVDAPVFTKLLSLYRHVTHSHTTEEWCAREIVLNSIVESGGKLELKMKEKVVKKDTCVQLQQKQPTKSAPPLKKKSALTTSIEQVIYDDEKEKDENKDDEDENCNTVTNESDSTVQTQSSTSNRFKCSLCTARFITLRDLTAHFRAQHQKKVSAKTILNSKMTDQCMKPSIEGTKNNEIKEKKKDKVIETTNELFEKDENADAENNSRTADESIIENKKLFTTTATSLTSTTISAEVGSLNDSSSKLCPLVSFSVIPHQEEQQQLLDPNNNENSLNYTEVAQATVSYQQQQTNTFVTPTYFTLPLAPAPAVSGVANYQYLNFQPSYQPFPLPPAATLYYPNPCYPTTTSNHPGYHFSHYYSGPYYQPPPPLPIQLPPTQPVQLTINNYGIINMQR